jgi:hypothetical protein
LAGQYAGDFGVDWLMATLAQIQTYALGNPGLRQRFQAGRVQVAWNILAEPGGGTSANRIAWRLKIFKDINADLDREYIWFLSHANVQNGTALVDGTGDAALVSAVASFVDAWAAVT